LIILVYVYAEATSYLYKHNKYHFIIIYSLNFILANSNLYLYISASFKSKSCLRDIATRVGGAPCGFRPLHHCLTLFFPAVVTFAVLVVVPSRRFGLGLLRSTPGCSAAVFSPTLMQIWHWFVGFAGWSGFVLEVGGGAAVLLVFKLFLVVVCRFQGGGSSLFQGGDPLLAQPLISGSFQIC